MLAVFAGIALAVRANRRLLVVRAHAGRIVRARGRAPGTLLHDFADVLSRARATCTVALVLRGGSVEVEVRGDAGPNVAQQLRNVVGRFPLARLRTAPAVARDK